MNRKIVLIIIFAIICIFFIMNFNTISGILFPKDTYIEVYVEESSAIKGGIININVRDSEEGKIIDSEEDINVTLIDKKREFWFGFGTHIMFNISIWWR